MNKTIVIIFYALFLFGTNYAQSNETLKSINPTELRNDIDSLVKYIEETHPNPFYKLSKDEFYSEIENIKSQIDTSLNLFDFYLLAEKLLAKLDDGHTSIRFPVSQYQETNPYLFPYIVKLSNKKPFIVNIRPFKTIEGEIPANAEIISINGIESEKIFNDIILFNSGETDNFKAACGADIFYFYLSKLYGMSNLYQVKYTIDTKTETKNIKGIKLDSLIKRMKQYSSNQTPLNQVDYSLKLMPETKTAIIDFMNFSDITKFKIFIDSAFEQISATKIQNLIIDIRNNGGGNSSIGDEFFQYISHKPFQQYSRFKVKYSRLQKINYREVRFAETNDSTFLYLNNKPNGFIEEMSDTSTIKLRNNPLRFNGNIYLLTSANTYSSAASFAQCFKYYNMGKIIGEETGGWIIHYGDIITTQLPNTKLDISISHKLWYEIGANDNDLHGVIPDIEVLSERALDYTLKHINEK